MGVANGFVTGDASTTGSLEVKKNSYAIGMSFSASGATFGLGYDSGKTISAGIGYSTGQITANAFYAKRDITYMHNGNNGTVSDPDSPDTGAAIDGMFDAGLSGLGMDVSYTMGASTLTMVYAKTDLSNIQPIIDADGDATFGSASLKGMGVGFSHDLGGGAKLVAGFGQVPTDGCREPGHGRNRTGFCRRRRSRHGRRSSGSHRRQERGQHGPVLLVLIGTVNEIREGAASAAPFL